MKTRRQLALVAAAVALLGLAACGGSGSGGFDIEDAAIAGALEQGRCVEHSNLMICPTDSSSGPVAMPGSGPIMVNTGLDPSGVILCTPVGDGSTCRVDVPIQAAGFTAAGQVRVAARTEPDGVWQVGDPIAFQGDASSPRFDASVRIPLPDRNFPAAQIAVQLAVLVFLEMPGEVPAEVHELSQTGADIAFVTVQFMVIRDTAPEGGADTAPLHSGTGSHRQRFRDSGETPHDSRSLPAGRLSSGPPLRHM